MTSNSASVLRSFVERIERPEDRARYVLDRVSQCRGISRRAIHRGYDLAGEVLGVDYETSKWALYFAFTGNLERLVACARPGVVGPLAGFVYHARSPLRPGQLKIGFSRNPDRRMRELSRFYGEPISLVSCTPGTMLDEHAVHCHGHAAWAQGEWFYVQDAAA